MLGTQKWQMSTMTSPWPGQWASIPLEGRGDGPAPQRLRKVSQWAVRGGGGGLFRGSMRKSWDLIMSSLDTFEHSLKEARQECRERAQNRLLL